MSLANLIRGKSVSVKFATATPATGATLEGEKRLTVANVATVAVANPPRVKTATPATVANDAEAFDCEYFVERAAVREFDGGYDRQEAERLAMIDLQSQTIH